TLIDNCDTLLLLGSKSQKTNKEIAEQIGKATVHNTAITESKGSSGSYSEADQILGRYLIDPAEIGRLERDECLVLITGVAPFKSKKYDVTKHPRWKEING
ncbi:MAG: TraM recognition domain-containing protein, partial [Eggerthellaceae bacterium]|nr:TraM recognition domain-containing protein [Eggerthellaceae bacterium]